VLSTPLVEACCDSVATARAAEAFGAGRIELCGLGDGGTTPSQGMIGCCRDTLRVPLHVMIRPSVEHFTYSSEEFDVMGRDIVAAKALGVDGVVFGILLRNGEVDVPRMAELLALARPLNVAFHRAFDRTPDAAVAMDALLLLGADFVLTAGHEDTALRGAPQLRALQRQAGSKLTVLAGGGVRGHNVRALLAESGVREIHARATDPANIRDIFHALAAT
jgi:copper homeostasis protein